MQTLTFNLSKKQGPFKPMNATNSGPWHKRHSAPSSGTARLFCHAGCCNGGICA